MLSSIQAMKVDLEHAKHVSVDEPDHAPVPHTSLVYTGRPGWPRIQVDPGILTTASQLGGPTALSRVFGVSSRMIRRQELEQGLVEPGDAVYSTFTDSDGHTTRIYMSSTGAQSSLTDNELDEIVLKILNMFPSFGRRMIDGHLHHLGHHVPRRRIQESYARVNGPPVSAFGLRCIQYRVYRVAGYNSLQHHDGQHGMLPEIL